MANETTEAQRRGLNENLRGAKEMLRAGRAAL
jgi:hypothetical protein